MKYLLKITFFFLLIPFLRAEEPQNKDWRESWENIGLLYKDENNPLIQKIHLHGRNQYQFGYVDGSANGNDFDYDTDEFRRMYGGATLNLLNSLEISGRANYFKDTHPKGGSDREFNFQNMYYLFGRIDVKDTFGVDGFDKLKIGYGARELAVSEEWNESSRRIKTVERSAISNKIWPFDSEYSNPTGIWIESSRNNVSTELGVFSSTQDDWLASWDDGHVVWGKAVFDVSENSKFDKTEVLLNGWYQDAEISEDRLGGGLEWATSAAVRITEGPLGIRFNGILGDNGDQTKTEREGSFWGFVVLPTYWLIDDKLEAVGRYQYQGSDNAQGIRLYSRYVRRADDALNIGLPNGGRGDEHHSFYTGLNYYISGNRMKIMAGIQYDDITSGGDDIYNGLSLFAAFRSYF